MHEKLGHVGEEIVKATAKSMNVVLTGDVEKCVDCAVAKARQKNIRGESEERATTPGVMARLYTFYNPTLESMDDVADVAFVTVVDGAGEEPRTFQEAWNHPEPEERKGWRGGIKKELSKMKMKQVWRTVKKESILENRRLIGNKWVFKRKKNGVYRARLVALGYS